MKDFVQILRDFPRSGRKKLRCAPSACEAEEKTLLTQFIGPPVGREILQNRFKI